MSGCLTRIDWADDKRLYRDETKSIWPCLSRYCVSRLQNQNRPCRMVVYFIYELLKKMQILKRKLPNLRLNTYTLPLADKTSAGNTSAKYAWKISKLTRSHFGRLLLSWAHLSYSLYGIISGQIFSSVLSQSTRLTDGRTDRQTDGRTEFSSLDDAAL